MLEIDGKNGGGQILRSALSLSMVTGRGFRMVNIRGGRKKPGLMRQHLTCVRAATEVCSANVEGAELGSTELVFHPNTVTAGDYQFSVGTAGSTTLVFQTLLPAMIFADVECKIEVTGGTHNPLAPSADFITEVFLPQAAKMGVKARLVCERVGFAPAGGGCIVASIFPSQLAPVPFLERGALLKKKVCAMVGNLSGEIMTRECAHAIKRLGWSDHEEVLDQVTDLDGAGNTFAIQLDYENISERATGHGAHGLSSERVAGRVAKEVKDYLKSEAPVGEHLADQLLLLMALAGGGSLHTAKMTNHIRTNIEVIQQFLDVTIETEEIDSHLIQIRVVR